MKAWTKSILTLLAASVLLTGAFSSCDSREDETDEEMVKWVYLYVTRPTNLLQTCVDNFNLGINCMAITGVLGADQYLVATMENVYTISVPTPRDKVALCDSLIESENFPVPGGSKNSDGETQTWTTGGKACVLQCFGAFWQSSMDKGECTSSNISNVLYPSTEEDGVYATCLEDCLTQGTIL